VVGAIVGELQVYLLIGDVVEDIVGKPVEDLVGELVGDEVGVMVGVAVGDVIGILLAHLLLLGFLTVFTLLTLLLLT